MCSTAFVGERRRERGVRPAGDRRRDRPVIAHPPARSSRGRAGKDEQLRHTPTCCRTAEASACRSGTAVPSQSKMTASNVRSKIVGFVIGSVPLAIVIRQPGIPTPAPAGSRGVSEERVGDPMLGAAPRVAPPAQGLPPLVSLSPSCPTNAVEQFQRRWGYQDRFQLHISSCLTGDASPLVELWGA